MIKKIFLMCLMVLTLASCTASGVSVNKSVNKYENDYSEVTAESVRLSGIPNAEFEKSINAELENGVQSELVAFDSLAAENSGNVRMGNRCILNITFDEKYNKNGFLSLVEEEYIYTGGAHGTTARIPKNIDITGEKTVKLADLFMDDGYVTTLNRLINERRSEHSEEYKELWEKPEIKDEHQTNFYIEDGNLVIFFQPYELSYYARGFVEFPLPLDELSGYMKEEYRRLLN